MLELSTDTTCPGCHHDVPVGRWCNRCGAALERSTGSPPSGRRWGLALVAAIAGLGAATALVATVGDDGGAPPDRGSLDSAVVLAQDPPAPPAPAPTRPTPPEQRVDVICSDLRVRSVPRRIVSTDQPGELVELAYGTCVVMDPNGAVTP